VTKNPGNGTYGPGLAQSFGYVGTGNKTYELKLHPNAKFADGTPVTAHAVKQWLTYYPTAHGGFASGSSAALLREDVCARAVLK
jgi:peptide/nickel transport system substrate-binding protein